MNARDDQREVIVPEYRELFEAAQARLRTSESTLRSLYDNTSFMMGVVELPDDDSDIIHVYDSRATTRFFGIDARSSTGASAQARHVPPEVMKRWIAAYRQAEGEQREVCFEYEHPTPAGPVTLSTAVSCLGRSGPGHTRFSFVTEDVTAARRAQEYARARDTHLLLAMSSSLSIAFEWDIARNTVRRTTSSEEALPETGEKTDTFEGVLQMVHPEDQAHFQENIRAALASPDGIYRSSHRIVRAGGEVRWLIETGRVEFDEQHAPQRLIGVSQDVTERHHAEEESRRQAQLTKLSREPIIVWTPERGIVDWNTGAEQLYGYPREEVLGRDIHSLLNTHHPTSLADTLAALEETGEWSGELHQRAKDGRELIVESRQQVLVVHGERLNLESNRDITERTRAEQALRVSEARFKRLFETNLLGIMFWDLSGVVREANDELLRIIGFPRADLEAGAINLSAITPPEHLASHQLALTELRRSGRHAPMEKELLKKDGTRAWGMLGMAMLGGDRGVGFLVDICWQKQTEAALLESEARFRAIADAIPGLVFVHSSEGNTSFVSQGFCEFSGRTTEQLLAAPWMELIFPDDLERVRPLISWSVAAGQRVEVEYRLRRHDGAWRWHLMRSVPQPGPDGSVSHWVATATDITDRKLSEEALKEADRRKDEFIAILAHELRNPLAPVRNAVEVLRRLGSPEPRQAKARNIIDRQLTHMARLIDDLLDVSRIARGKLALQTERCDLAAIAQQTAEDYRSTLEAAGLSLEVQRPDAPAWVQGDPVRLAQMIGNLLNNSSRFTEGGGRVGVLIGEDAGGAFVRVTDTGVGIEPGLLSRLFDPFSQAEQDFARTKGGLGLGLALTRGLAELHGGRIDATSEGTDRGAAFTIHLPSAGPGAQAGAGPQPQAEHGGLRILLVEDNHDAAESLADLLELSGHEVKLAYDGASALQAAHEFNPGVVISDLGLPGQLDGYAVARALRTDPTLPGVRLIALSGYANDEARRRSSEAGFDVHLAKPPDLERLRQALTGR